MKFNAQWLPSEISPMGYHLSMISMIVASVIMGIICCSHSWEHGYIEACKDFQAGKSRYELKEFPGGEKKWVKKGEW